MNTITLNSQVQKTTAGSYGTERMSLPTSPKTLLQEEAFDFSTIDGGMITYNAGTKAIDTGAGIFIGDYFVGVSDSYHAISNMPFVLY
jgi:hypothetical protein